MLLFVTFFEWHNKEIQWLYNTILIQQSMHSFVMCLSAVLLSINQMNFKLKAHAWNTFFKNLFWQWNGDQFFFMSRRISPQQGRQEQKESMALGCAWMDRRTKRHFTFCFSVAGKSSTGKISIHNDMYIFAKLYKVALIVNSSGNHNNALTHQEVLPCGWVVKGDLKRKKYIMK